MKTCFLDYQIQRVTMHRHISKSKKQLFHHYKDIFTQSESKYDKNPFVKAFWPTVC